MNKSLKIIPEEIIERRICVINGHNVMFDFDLADLYGVPTKVLNQAVTRNKDRFPAATHPTPGTLVGDTTFIRESQKLLECLSLGPGL